LYCMTTIHPLRHFHLYKFELVILLLLDLHCTTFSIIQSISFKVHWYFLSQITPEVIAYIYEEFNLYTPTCVKFFYTRPIKSHYNVTFIGYFIKYIFKYLHGMTESITVWFLTLYTENLWRWTSLNDWEEKKHQTV
jgi:hypothetical protein